MTDKPKDSSEKMFDRMYDIYLNLDGVDPIPDEARHMIFTLMESYAKQEVKEACRKQREITGKKKLRGWSFETVV